MCHSLELDELAEKYRRDPDLVHMQDISINYVPGRGSCSPRVLLVGEAPGKFENFYVKPFTGPAGRLLQEFMVLASLDETNTYITNVVKFHPTDKYGNNRTPTSKEIEVSGEYLHEEQKLLGDPKLIVPVGAISAKQFIPKVRSIFSVAGRLHVLGKYRIFPMVHPAYVMRNPPQRSKSEEQWKWLGKQIELLGGAIE